MCQVSKPSKARYLLPPSILNYVGMQLYTEMKHKGEREKERERDRSLFSKFPLSPRPNETPLTCNYINSFNELLVAKSAVAFDHRNSCLSKFDAFVQIMFASSSVARIWFVETMERNVWDAYRVPRPNKLISWGWSGVLMPWRSGGTSSLYLSRTTQAGCCSSPHLHHRIRHAPIRFRLAFCRAYSLLHSSVCSIFIAAQATRLRRYADRTSHAAFPH